MSTDRELLENAAKAAGIGGFWVDAGLNTGSNSTPRIWNPLADDGDALRLAVKLNIRIRPMPGFGDDCVLCSADHKNAWAQEPFANDPLAATRRAIVRAAAEIGRSKE
jgi:hypothetical protein